MSRIVVKVGGAVAGESAGAVLELARENQVCVVHGAGPQISAEMELAGIPVEFVDGRRVTTEAGVAIVRSSLAAVNTALCAAIGERAVPLFGDEIGLTAAPVPELGLVGEFDELLNGLSLPAITDALEAGKIPVVAPIAVGPLNVNADDAASAIARTTRADELRFLTDVEGFMVDGKVVDWIDYNDAVKLLHGGTLEGGIIPKLRGALMAAEWGVRALIGRTEIEPVPWSTGVPLTLIDSKAPPLSGLDLLRLHGQPPGEEPT
jgi:acetylglutamate kinase